MAPVLTIEDLRPRLITLDQVREKLATTEPLSEISFDTTADSKVKFRLEPGWNAALDETEGTDQVDAYVRINNVDYRMTKDAALEATSLIGLTKKYVTDTPGELVVPHLNYWYRNKQKELKALCTDSSVLAFTKGGVRPFSNLRMIDTISDGLIKKFGEGEILVDYKFFHTLRHSYVRLILPDYRVPLETTRGHETWSLGVQFYNSLVGEKPTELNGYLFNWWCTNGATSVHASSGRYSRRTMGQGDEVFEWAAASVENILDDLEPEIGAMNQMIDTPLAGEVNEVLSNIFHEFRVPLGARDAIIANMVESEDLSAYGVHAAITQAANEGNISPEAANHLLLIGGALPHVMIDRCASCHQFIRHL